MSKRICRLLLLLGPLLGLGCEQQPVAERAAGGPGGRPHPTASTSPSRSTRTPEASTTNDSPRSPASAAGRGPNAASRPAPATPARIVAVGDLHGDLDASRSVLRLAGLVDAADAWIGGRAVLVQVGDVLDGGADERALLELLERLRAQAHAAGGEVHTLLGNHELWNVAGNFRYASPAGIAAFASFADADPSLARVAPPQRGRLAAFRPGGPWARKLADSPVVLQLGDTVFVHAAVLPKHVDRGIARINADARAFLLGEAPRAYAFFTEWDSPVMSRHFGDDPGVADCLLLEQALARLAARRMVIGHTVQYGGIAPGCAERVWRVDAGIAKRYGGRREALEIRGQTVRILRGGS